MTKQPDRRGTDASTREDAIPDPERRRIIRKLAGAAAGAVLVTVLLTERTEAS